MFIALLKRNDAEAYLKFLKRLDIESEYMHYRPGEREMNVHGLSSRIGKQDRQGNSFTVLAWDQEMITGYFSVNGGNSLSSCHSADVAIGVLGNWRGKGIARRLFSTAIEYCIERSISRLQCSVVWENEQAIKFYLSSGFKPCGFYKSSFRHVTGKKMNEWILERFIDEK
jgi:GNAT superfamily N-acetyltransferase